MLDDLITHYHDAIRQTTHPAYSTVMVSSLKPYDVRIVLLLRDPSVVFCTDLGVALPRPLILPSTVVIHRSTGQDRSIDERHNDLISHYDCVGAWLRRYFDARAATLDGGATATHQEDPSRPLPRPLP